MKKINKIFILLLIIVTLFTFSNTLSVVKAETVRQDDDSGTTKIIDTNIWKPNETESPKLKTVAGIIISIIKVIGTIVSVGALSLIGIKYMTGSVENKAEYKKSMIPYLVGAIMLFACSNLVQIIYDVSHDL